MAGLLTKIREATVPAHNFSLPSDKPIRSRPPIMINECQDYSVFTACWLLSWMLEDTQRSKNLKIVERLQIFVMGTKINSLCYTATNSLV